MFSFLVRRVAFNARTTSIDISLKAAGPRTVAGHTFSYRRSRQRRYSSSKPSSPSGGSKGISEGQQVPSSHTQARRRREKDVNGRCKERAWDDAMQNLPSVPNTHHIKDEDIAASAFFSLHRPISVTSSFPKAITEDAFAAIFTPWMNSNTKRAEVISALSSTLHKLESATRQERWNAEADDLRATVAAEANQIPEGDIMHLDQSSYIPFPPHVLSGSYQPFNPPPPPQVVNKAESHTTGSETSAETIAPQHRTYTAVITIKESTDGNGEVTWMAHSTPLVAEVEEPFVSENQADQAPKPTKSRRRHSIRQRFEEQGEQRTDRTGVWAISVKRQRKLKMKKHKYKKLMRRTRNLRRRLDRN